MSKRIKFIFIFLVFPVVMIAALFLSLYIGEKSKSKEEETTQAGRTDEEINQMLLAEYQKSQSTRQEVEYSTEAATLAPTDEEYDDMIGDASEDSQETMEMYEGGDLSEEEEAIIAKAEQDARNNRAAANYNGILVVSSMNKVAVTGGFDVNLTAEELAAEHPLFLQYDPRWAGYPYGTGTMKSSACGPTSFAMCITALTNITNASPPLVATYSMNHGHYVPGAGTAHSLFLNGCSDFGLYCHEISNTEAEMCAAIDRGEMLILSVHYGNFTHSGAGHFIVIYGYNSNGFMVNDPGSYERSCKYWPYSVIAGDINKIYALGKQ